MKVLFVYSIQKSILREKPLLGQEGIYIGISSIAGVLKKEGHSCEIVVLDRQYKQKNNTTLITCITSFSPDVIAFTSVFSEFEFICTIACQVKQLFPNLFLYAGGIHISLNPNDKYLDIFDAICIGEGEFPTLELLDKMQVGMDISNIPNLWVKTATGISKNAPRPYISNLDILPYPDREMWQKHILEKNTKLTVLVGRGCPFNCTYCCNHSLRKITTGNYVRLRSPENILSEIRDLRTIFPYITEIYLEVETLTISLEWLNEFCSQLHLFGEETSFKIKFGTNLRISPNLDVDSVFQNLKRANITSVTIGLESGNYRIRKEILNREYSNDIILKAAQKAKEYGIDIALFNMIGLPTETLAEFSETLKMNQLVQPSFHATSIFFPYQGTQLYEMCKQMGLVSDNIKTKDERQIAILDLPGFSKKQIQKSFDSFHYNVYKTYKNKSLFKLVIYYSMKYLGHNFYANLKIKIIRILYRLNSAHFLNRKFLSIFQKT